MKVLGRSAVSGLDGCVASGEGSRDEKKVRTNEGEGSSGGRA